MFSKIGMNELLVIGVVLLLIFGPSKLPQLGKALGDTIRNFKEGASSSKEGKKEDKE